MGVDYGVYVGAYLVIEAEPVEYLDTPHCPRGCGSMGNFSFCPVCGTKMERDTGQRPAMLYDLTERTDLAQLNNSSWGPAKHIILAVGNVKKEKSDHICNIEDNDLEVIPISPADIPQQINNFEWNYGSAIDELRKVADVQVRFGVISYAM